MASEFFVSLIVLKPDIFYHHVEISEKLLEHKTVDCGNG